MKPQNKDEQQRYDHFKAEQSLLAIEYGFTLEDLVLTHYLYTFLGRAHMWSECSKFMSYLYQEYPRLRAMIQIAIKKGEENEAKMFASIEEEKIIDAELELQSTDLQKQNSSYCLFGWKSPKPCSYSGGCTCLKKLKHPGKCRCETCGSSEQRPADWDSHGREDANK